MSGLLKLSSTVVGRKVFLTSHGNSRSGAMQDLGPSCFACLVHTTDDDNVVWTESTVNVRGRESKILRKTALTTPGFVLAAASYPRRLSAEGQSNKWWPLPGLTSNVIVKPTAGVWTDVDMTTVWRFVRRLLIPWWQRILPCSEREMWCSRCLTDGTLGHLNFHPASCSCWSPVGLLDRA